MPWRKFLTVVIESPWDGDASSNLEYARRAMRDSLARGESPFVSHLLYGVGLGPDEDGTRDRELEKLARFRWGKLADKFVVYTDLGISSGMEEGIEFAREQGIPVEYRSFSADTALVPYSGENI